MVMTPMKKTTVMAVLVIATIGMLACGGSAAGSSLLRRLQVQGGGDGLDPSVKDDGTTVIRFATSSEAVRVEIDAYDGPTDPKCNMDLLFLVDRSGSMKRVTVPTFTAASVISQTVRKKGGNSRVSANVFADKIDHVRPTAQETARMDKDTGKSWEKCNFCFQKSNLYSEPFTNPRKFASNKMTAVMPAFSAAIDIMRKDSEGKGPECDGERASAKSKRPYQMVLISDMMQTINTKPTAAQVQKVEKEMLEAFCHADWKKCIDRNADGRYSFNKGKDASCSKFKDMKDYCKESLASLHYLYFETVADKKDHTATDNFMKVTQQDFTTAARENVPLSEMNEWFKKHRLEKYKGGKPGSSKYGHEHAYDMFSGAASLGLSYNAKLTPVYSFLSTEAHRTINTMELVNAVLDGSGCKPLGFKMTVVEVTLKAAPLPKLDLNVPPVSRHYRSGYQYYKIDPSYATNKDKTEFLSGPLEDYAKKISAFRAECKAYVDNINSQLDDLVLAPHQNSEFKSKLSKALKDSKKHIFTANKSCNEALKAAYDRVKLQHVYVGGYASMAGASSSAGDKKNQDLSKRRALGLTCLAKRVFDKVDEISDYTVSVGSFGFTDHCRKAREMLFITDKSECTASAAADLQGKLKAHAAKSSKDAASVKALEDDARKAQIHFQESTAKYNGFVGECCVPMGAATCAATGLPKCVEKAEDPFKAKYCDATDEWQSNWGGYEQKLNKEIEAVKTVMAQIKTDTAELDLTFKHAEILKKKYS